MNTNNNYDELIERFLDGTFSDPEKAAFIEKMNNNPELEKAVKEQTWLRENWRKAHQLRKTREEVANAIKREKAQKRRQKITWIAAASVLLLFAIPTMLYFNKEPGSSIQIAKDTQTDDTTQEIIGTPQFKKAEEKATYGIADTVKLIAPKKNQQFSRNDSIVFRWIPVLSDSTYIVIQNGKLRQTVFKEKLLKGRSGFTLEAGFLPEGAYRWYLQGNDEKAAFTVHN